MVDMKIEYDGCDGMNSLPSFSTPKEYDPTQLHTYIYGQGTIIGHHEAVGELQGEMK